MAPLRLPGMVVVLAACGAVVNPTDGDATDGEELPPGGASGQGASGQGASGQGASGAGASGQGSGGAPMTTTGPEPTACEIACGLDCPNPSPSCVDDCEATVPAECMDEYEVVLECVIPRLTPDCVIDQDLCPVEVTAFSTCVNAAMD